MNSVYKNIQASIKKKEKLLAVLIDPDKTTLEALPSFMDKLNASIATHVFVGGSEVSKHVTQILIAALKNLTKIPVVVFPGDITQISENADALLFLSLISGRNPDYLIDKHVQAIPLLKASELEVIPTGYVLIESGKKTSVERVTKTQPMKRNEVSKIVDTSLAGQLLGQKLMYLEAGSGATHPIDSEIIAEVKKAISIPLIVGGGVRSKKQLDDAYGAGADMVVVGTAFEEDEAFFNELN